MKKFLLILSLFVSVAASANLRDTVIVHNDTVLVAPGSIVLEPIIVNAVGDSAFSLGWSAFNLTSDTTQGCQTYVQLYGKNGQSVANFNQPIPASVVKVWGTDNSVIDDYILAQNPRFRRYVPKVTSKN
jgi:hypothetical protein